MPTADHLWALVSGGLDALREHLITPEQATEMPTDDHLWALVSGGLDALREHLITPEQAAKMPTSDHLLELFREEGLDALREHLITPEQAAKMPTDDHLKILLSKEGLYALNNGLITPAQLIALKEEGITLSAEHLEAMVSPIGRQALERKLITLKEASDIPIKHLHVLLRDVDSLEKALQKGLKLEQAKEMKTVEHLSALLTTPGAIEALVQGRITVEQINNTVPLAKHTGETHVQGWSGSQEPSEEQRLSDAICELIEKNAPTSNHANNEPRDNHNQNNGFHL
jgi:hypothetical protein